MENIKQKIIDFYKNYNINFTITDVVESYAVARYFIKLDRTTKNKLANVEKLVNDLSVELNVKNINFNKNYFEVPNEQRKTLNYKDITYKPANSNFGLYVCFGKDLNNKEYIVNLCDTPHLLVAGSTGSGKSVFINSILTSLLENYKKEQLQISLIDPKKVELSIYKDAEQVEEIGTNLEQSKKILEKALIEIDNRYKTMELSHCRKIETYNQKAIEKLPYKLIVIDELADIILQDRKNTIKETRKNPNANANSLESLICRIAQIGRASGVHLIVATQRPSSDIITGLIKANIPSRVSFAVSSRIDSRVILDEKGAEKLTGKGDMLFKMVGSDTLERLQGIFITDEEVENIVNNNIDYEKIRRQEVLKFAETLELERRNRIEQDETIKKMQQEQQQEKKEKRMSTLKVIGLVIWNILKWICIILFGGIYLIFKFCCKLAGE